MEQYTYADGKYTVINNNGNLSALRYGEPWRDLTGDNLVYWMLVETLRLAAPPSQTEPVAWIVPTSLQWKERESERVVKITRRAQPAFVFTTPLYTAPPEPSDLVSTLRAILAVSKQYDTPSFNVISDAARTALAARGVA